MSAARDLLVRHRVAAVVLVAMVVLLAALALAGAMRSHEAGAEASRTGRPSPAGAGAPTVRARSEPVDARQLSSADQAARRATIKRLRSIRAVTPATSPEHQAIRGEAARQADLYAAEFSRRLLTQNYRSPRADLLAWVQSEAAPSTEPTVVGLVPGGLRDKLAVASVQEGFDGPGPVPAPGVWETLGDKHGHTTVVIQRVVEPVAWSAAVAAGTITDPGVTARRVDAEVTLHLSDHGQAQRQRYSVALTMNLEGPPVRDSYGLVTVVRYQSIRVG